MPTVIGRNRRQYIRNIQDAYTECHRYNPETGEMERTDPADAWLALDTDDPLRGDENKASRLIEEDGRAAYRVTVGGSEIYYVLTRPNR